MRSNRKSWLFIYIQWGEYPKIQAFFSPLDQFGGREPFAFGSTGCLWASRCCSAAVVSDIFSQKNCYPLADCWRPPEDGTWFSVLHSSPLSRSHSLSEHRFFVFTLCEHQLQVLKNSMLGQGLALSEHQLCQALGAGLSLSMFTMFKTTVKRYFF